MGLVAGALVATACIDTTSTLPPSAAIKFINTSPLAGDSLVNLYINGTIANATAQPFFSGSVLYTGAVSSAVPFTVKSAFDTTITLATGSFPLAVDSSYNILFAANLSGSTVGGGVFDNNHTLIYLPDTVQQSTTNARFQFVNVAGRYGDSNPLREVNLYLVPMGDTATPPSSQLNVTPVAHFDIMPFTNVAGVNDTALRRIVVRRTSDNSVVTFTDSIPLANGYVTTLILGDAPGVSTPKVYHLDIFRPF